MKICVIGGGNGGQALAGFLALRGYDVSLYNRSEWRISRVIKTKKIRLEGEINAVGSISFATTDIRKAIEGRKLLMVVLPASAHRDIAKKIAPYLEDGQVIVLNPGRTAGALEFRNVLKEEDVKRDVIIAEAQTFVFASRLSNPGSVRIFRIKNAVPVAALPASKNPELEEVLLNVMPEFEIAESTLYTSFNNIGAVFHPATIILNTGWIETSFGKFEFYFEGISTSVAKVLEKIDEERCEIARRIGMEPMTAVQWLSYAYDVHGTDLYSAIHNNEGYRGIQAPVQMDSRYITEDVPASLVPLSAFGKLVEFPTPTIDAIIHLASIMMNTDFFKEGRNFEKLHLTDKTIEQVRRIMEVGE
ncbi:MAG TPA: NAD/NADP octopine/nopaline dehydrogenase family protein [Fervidobacterium sp.]|nr:NAD/NADP octopine/nopaline dehydrogenase family protein [Fervidobacterium sp.]HPC78911.1 NAD/NADP octopine/nopaline dehydrogenase family protein [Fervidobacterium sp.]HRT00967.1 NAD/NADP octopine/nopaline dehydrogenase family protein [Fervidobacterium sp.]HRV38387.1 NAD/NADP octopine/nopaline dehydrogenase family protein [Fervidobacterium sp.]